MITFYPGPSKVYPQLQGFMADAYNSGILSVNHRSRQFMEMCEKTINLLHIKLNIPEDYTILFVSSATECWEIISQSFTDSNNNEKSLHFYNGAFGKKWAVYNSKLNKNNKEFSFSTETEIDVNLAEDSSSFDNSIICLTQNETSNGTKLSNDKILSFQQKFSQSLIAVDATSSLGGSYLKFENADIWFASVQKCLGLPAGMGLLIVSPKAIEKAKKINDNRFYNSFLFMHENILHYQTHYTPNVLGIYLLMRVMDTVGKIYTIDTIIKNRAKEWYNYFEKHQFLKPLIKNESTRSDTVIAITTDEEEYISIIKNEALNNGIVLGNGYGEWKNNTLRIANFPQIEDWEIENLKDFLSGF